VRAPKTKLRDHSSVVTQRRTLAHPISREKSFLDRLRRKQRTLPRATDGLAGGQLAGFVPHFHQ
jgi:hypothetical protein